FFFSSRRRHTRSYGDWSSDVCSSDLPTIFLVARHRAAQERQGLARLEDGRLPAVNVVHQEDAAAQVGDDVFQITAAGQAALLGRSEERRVGKEGSDRGAP